MQEEKQQGLKSHTIALMIATALFFDTLQFLLGFLYMGWLVGIFAGLTFWLWFRMHGISFMKPKRLFVFGGASFVEIIPIPLVASLPAWTAAVAYLGLEAKIKKAVEKLPGGKIVEKAAEKAGIMGKK